MNTGRAAKRAETRAAEPGSSTVVRVVDCSEGIAGPVAAMMLAEAGADVIKVEPPDGDRSRASQGFLTWNRSKRSVVLDLRTESGRDQLGHLLAGADVLIHGFGPTTAGELGLTDDQLAARHPQLVTCAVLGWPAGHPSADGPIDDLLVTARLGLCDEQRGHREGPVFLRFPFGSWCARLPLRHRDPGPADPTASGAGPTEGRPTPASPRVRWCRP